MSKKFMPLMTSNNRTISIVREGTLVYWTSTVVSYDSYSGPCGEIEINAFMQDVDLSSRKVLSGSLGLTKFTSIWIIGKSLKVLISWCDIMSKYGTPCSCIESCSLHLAY